MALTRGTFWVPDPCGLRPSLVLSLTTTDEVQTQANTQGFYMTLKP